MESSLGAVSLKAKLHCGGEMESVHAHVCTRCWGRIAAPRDNFHYHPHHSKLAPSSSFKDGRRVKDWASVEHVWVEECSMPLHGWANANLSIKFIETHKVSRSLSSSLISPLPHSRVFIVRSKKGIVLVLVLKCTLTKIHKAPCLYPSHDGIKFFVLIQGCRKDDPVLSVSLAPAIASETEMLSSVFYIFEKVWSEKEERNFQGFSRALMNDSSWIYLIFMTM